MKRSVTNWGLRGVSILGLSIAMAAVSYTGAYASTIQIQFGGADLNYYEATGTFCDNGGGVGCFAAEDMLDTMTFKADGVTLGTLLPGVSVGSIGLNMLLFLGAAVDPTINATYSLLASESDVFDAEINSVPGLFTDVTSGSVTFSNGSVNATGSGFSSVFAQSLPFSISANDPINWSFSAGIGACSGAVGERVCTYSGTGELSFQGNVPEPTSLLLLGAALTGIGIFRRKTA